jgi:signal transduction histidine kinase
VVSDFGTSARSCSIERLILVSGFRTSCAIDFAADRIELKQIKVVKNYDDNICGILVDIQKIKVAFLNIIVNAIEAMDDGGILTISTENINNKCVSKIKDNGKGMTREQLGRLFEPYFTTKEKGNGLGLANSQNIILGHNGSISAESEPGVGTTFTIIFDFN